MTEPEWQGNSTKKNILCKERSGTVTRLNEEENIPYICSENSTVSLSLSSPTVYYSVLLHPNTRKNEEKNTYYSLLGNTNQTWRLYLFPSACLIWVVVIPSVVLTPASNDLSIPSLQGFNITHPQESQISRSYKMSPYFSNNACSRFNRSCRSMAAHPGHNREGNNATFVCTVPLNRESHNVFFNLKKVELNQIKVEREGQRLIYSFVRLHLNNSESASWSSVLLKDNSWTTNNQHYGTLPRFASLDCEAGSWAWSSLWHMHTSMPWNIS